MSDLHDPALLECDWSLVPEIEARIPALLAHARQAWPDREVLVFDDQRMTYGELAERSARMARQLLDHGISKGARVGILFPNDPRFVIAWFAIARIGAVAVPISTLAPEGELLRVLRHADLQLLIAADQYLKHDYLERLAHALPTLARGNRMLRLPEAPYLRSIWIWGDRVPQWATAVDLDRVPEVGEALLAAVEAEVAPADPVCIIHTSGSTGEPKGVIHSHGGFMRQAGKLTACRYPPWPPQARVFTQMPFFWVGGLTMNLLNLMHRGATSIGSARTGAALLDLLQDERVSFFSGWRTLAKAVVADPSFAGRQFPHMVGGSLWEALPAHMRPDDEGLVGTALGMSETAGPHTVESRRVPERLRGSFGRPIPGMEHRIVDPETGQALAPGERGHLLVRGDALMLGLVKRERSEVFDPDGWYCTGDIVSMRDGHLFFHGRLDDMIKTSGANVSPREVESALLAQPGVAQAFVFGMPDAGRGMVIAAVVVLAAGCSLDEDALVSGLGADLASFKMPRVLRALSQTELPLAASGKPDRKALKKILEEQGRRLRLSRSATLG